MAPPVKTGGPAPACQDNLSPIDFAPFNQLPKLGDLHKLKQRDVSVKTIYNMLDVAHKMDQELGNQDGKLDSTEVDAFLKKLPENQEFFDTCTFMAQFRNFSSHAPALKAELEKPLDQASVDLNFFRALPFLDKFPVFDPKSNEISNPITIKQKITDSPLPAKLKELLLKNEELIYLYYTAQIYLTHYSHKDPNLFSVEDAQANLSKMGISNVEAVELLYDVRSAALHTASQAFAIRDELSLEAAPGLLDISSIIILSELVPQFAHASPLLSAFISSAFPNGQPGPEVQDRIITLEEFKNFQGIQEYLKLSGKSPEQAFQSLQAIGPNLNLPVSLWPEELKETYGKMDQASQSKLDALMQLPVETQQMDYMLRMMEAESLSKYQQEKMDHSGSGRLFISAVSYVVTLGNWSWQDYFKNKRPQAHKDMRDSAIGEFKKAIRENNFKTLDEATGWFASNKADAHQVLINDCHYNKWMGLAKMTQNIDRNRELLKLAEEFRVGDFKLWESDLFPSPRLGKGGWWDRAFESKNWVWGKSPEIVMALSLNNYITVATPNNFAVLNHPDFSLLAAQIPQDKRAAFTSVLEKISQGEEVQNTEIQAALNVPELSPEGQAELMTQIRTEIVKTQNQKAIQNNKFQAEYNKLSPEQKQKAEQLVGTVMQLFVDPMNPMDPARVKMAVESLDSTLSQIAGVDISKEKQLVMGIAGKEFPESFKKVLIESLGQMKRVEGSQKPATALEALFREAQFQNPVRARELFNLPRPTEEQQAEFIEMLKASSLSNENKQTFLAILITQPNSLIAEKAEENGLAIIGSVKNPKTGEYSMPIDPLTHEYNTSFSGNVHSAQHTTLARSLFGVGAYAAPTLVGGSAGHALFTSIRNYSTIPLEEITGVRRWIIPGRTFHRLGNSGAGRILGNPVAGTIIGGLLGSAFTVSPYGESLRQFAYDGINYPYYPWSDMAVMNAPREGVNLYLNMAASLQGMDAVLGGAKTVGTLELGTRLGNGWRALNVGGRLAQRLEGKLPPKMLEWLRGGTGINTIQLGSAWRSAGNAFLGKTEAQITEEVLKGADVAGAKWAADVPELASAERVWAKQAYGKAQQDLVTTRNWFTSQSPQAQRFTEIQDALANPALQSAERLALQMEMRTLSTQISPNALQRLQMVDSRVRSLEILGKVGRDPYFSSSILKRAKEWMEKGIQTGDVALQERAWLYLQKGAVQYVQLPSLAMHNNGTAKFMLWMLFNEKGDEATRSVMPIITKFPENIAPGAIIPPQPLNIGNLPALNKYGRAPAVTPK